MGNRQSFCSGATKHVAGLRLDAVRKAQPGSNLSHLRDVNAAVGVADDEFRAPRRKLVPGVVEGAPRPHTVLVDVSEDLLVSWPAPERGWARCADDPLAQLIWEPIQETGNRVSFLTHPGYGRLVGMSGLWRSLDQLDLLRPPFPSSVDLAVVGHVAVYEHDAN